MDWRTKQNQLQGRASNNAGWLEHMNCAVSYLEENLCDADVEQAAQIVGCSGYHFQRIFSFLAGMSLAQYLRRRRLTMAAFALQEGRPVLEVALESGYESPEAFARAFKNLHGVAPSGAKEQGVSLKAWPRISFQIARRGEIELDYHIEKKEALTFFGAHTWISTENANPNTAIPAFWRQCRGDGTMDRIRKMADLPENTPLHVATYHCTDAGYDYLIGTHWNRTDSPEEYALLAVPAADWAIFPTAGLSMEEAQREIALLWSRIFTEWFPTSGYELAQAPELELHFRLEDELYQNEIWIPVRRM